MSNICQDCGAPLKVIPAGISKSTGKPYKAFKACSQRCGYTEKIDEQNQPNSFVKKDKESVEVLKEISSDIKEIKDYIKDIMVEYAEKNKLV
jgi:hypothetical protein